jgi:hypothetical protein
VFTARYELIPYIKQIRLCLYKFNCHHMRSGTSCLMTQSGHFYTTCENLAYVLYEFESGINNPIILGLLDQVSEMWIGFMYILFWRGYYEEAMLSKTSLCMKFSLCFRPWTTYLKCDRLFQKSLYIEFIVVWNSDVNLMKLTLRK